MNAATVALFTSAVATFFVVIDPPGCAPIFASLTSGASARHRRSMALRSTFTAGAILIFFAILGRPLLKTLSVSLDAFRVAGGLMLFLIAIDMVFEKRTERREDRAAEVREDCAEAHVPVAEVDISVFPMAIPMIAGPGSIASVMLQVARADSWTERAIVLGALASVLLLTTASLLAAGPLMASMGVRIENMITRLLGVVLAALAAQFVIDGIRRAFHLG